MKIKVYSQTGKPTDIDSALEYEKEFKARYDLLWDKKQKGEISIDDMRLELDNVDKELKSKYPMYKEVPMPKSGKQWKNMIKEFECPVTLAITEEGHELALFLMDAGY